MMANWRITLANDWPVGWMAAVAAGAAVLLAVGYWLGMRRLRPLDVAILFALRVAALAVVILLLFRPTVHFASRLTERGQVIVLVDESMSMGVKDGPGGLNRLGWAQDVLMRPQGVLERLRRNFDVAVYAFAGSVRTVPLDEVRDLVPVGESTRLSNAVGAVGEKVPRESLAGVIMLTDGIDTSGVDPADAIVGRGVPMYTVGVGTRLDEDADFRDLFVQDVRTPRYVMVDNVSEVTVAVGGVGYAGREVTVQTREGETVLASARAVVRGAGATELVPLKFTPRKVGQFEFVAEVPPESDERVSENNRMEFTLVVTEPKVRVLYVEGSARPEYKFLKRALDSDPNMEVLALVQVAPGVFMQQGRVGDLALAGVPSDEEVLRQFRVFVFGDIDRAHFGEEVLRAVERAVSNGAGLLMLGGRASLGPGGYEGSPLEEVSPVLFGPRSVGRAEEPFLFRLTREGQGHPIFEGTEEFFSETARPVGRPVPMLQGCTRVVNLKPGALVLAEHPTAEGLDRERLPVAVVQSYGQGRAMVFTADTTWRWFLELRPLGAETPYARFWAQAVRWLAGQEARKASGEPGLTMYTDRLRYSLGEAVRVRVVARAEDGQAADRATITVAIAPAEDEKAFGTMLQLSYMPGTAGEYAGEFTPAEAGAYVARASGTQDGMPLGSPVSTTFRVGNPNLEFERLSVNEELLRRVAELTGGRYAPAVRAEEVVESLRRVEVERQVARSYRLWNAPYFFLLFVCVVTAEWVMRRRRQLP